MVSKWWPTSSYHNLKKSCESMILYASQETIILLFGPISHLNFCIDSRWPLFRHFLNPLHSWMRFGTAWTLRTPELGCAGSILGVKCNIFRTFCQGIESTLTSWQDILKCKDTVIECENALFTHLTEYVQSVFSTTCHVTYNVLLLAELAPA